MNMNIGGNLTPYEGASALKWPCFLSFFSFFGSRELDVSNFDRGLIPTWRPRKSGDF